MMMLPSTCIPGVSEPQLARGFGSSLERVAAGDRGAIRVILHDSLADGSSSRQKTHSWQRSCHQCCLLTSAPL